MREIEFVENAVGNCSEAEQAILSDAAIEFRLGRPSELSAAFFERIHSKHKQRALGITYTPKPVCRELTRTTLTFLEKMKSLEGARICDPCCGSGLFALTLIEELESKGIAARHAINDVVFFQDVDRISVCITLVGLYIWLEKRGIDPKLIQPNAKVGDFFESTDTYDAFITNPPYVKIQNLPDINKAKLKIQFPKVFQGSIGLAPLFLMKMFEQLTDAGVLGVITQNNFFTSNAAFSLRSELMDYVRRIDTFGGKHVFEDVSAYTCLVYLSKRAGTNFSFRRLESKADLASTPHLIATQSLATKKWRLGSAELLLDLQRLESRGTQLDSACRIWVGIATQFDKAFTVHRRSGEWITTAPDGSFFAVEPEAVQPLIKVASLTDHESINGSAIGVIYPYQINGKAVLALEEADFSSQFPLAHSALLQWKKQLLARQKGKHLPRDWYKWGRIQSMIPIADKLLTKTFSKGPQFYRDTSSSLFSNGYALKPVDSTYDISFVQAVLNSRVFEHYVRSTSFEIEGDYQCYQKNFIYRFNLPTISQHEQRVVASSASELEGFLIDYFKLQSVEPCMPQLVEHQIPQA